MRAYLTVFIGTISIQSVLGQPLSTGQPGNLDLRATVLTNAAQVRKLTAVQAAQAIPVQLRGVVIDESQPSEHAVILADQTASLYLRAATNLFAPNHRRDVLEIKGVTSQGEFAPMVLATSSKKIGEAPTPPGRPTTYQELITGALDAQFVKITGVVRQCWPALPDDDTWRIVLAADGGLVPVRIPLPQDPKIQEDTEVTIQAVCLYQFNKKRQALSPVLQVPRGLTVRIDRPSPANPFATPAQSLASLLQFSYEIPFGHRVHVHGIVTSSQRGSVVWIRDGYSGLRIQTRQEEDLQPGDEIDVLGFPGFGSSTPVLEDAVYRKARSSVPPEPLLLTNISEAYEHQDELVSLNARLTDIQPVLSGLAITLEENGTVFKGVLRLPLKPNVEPAWEPGSLVRVTGICDVIYDSTKPVMGMWHPQSFQILLRSAADVRILQPPSWWNTQHIVFLFGIFASVALAVSGGVALQARRRLNEQGRRRAMAEAEFAAILSERNRLAREIHDTLAQGFTSTLLQLQLVKLNAANDISMNYHLERAQQLIRESLKEARNSIWQMHPQVLETGDLATALKNIVKQLSDGTVLETRFEVSGRERRFPPVIETNILRLGQEAITNAARHAQAKHIDVKLDFGESHFSLTVIDDGCGFDTANPPASEGGYGMVAMKERAHELHGELIVHTAPNEGTRISLRIPLTDASSDLMPAVTGR